MKANGRIEYVKKVDKQIKNAYPVETGLALGRYALVRALGFVNRFRDQCQSWPYSSSVSTG